MGKHKKVVKQLVAQFEQAIMLGNIDEANKFLLMLHSVNQDWFMENVNHLLTNEEDTLEELGFDPRVQQELKFNDLDVVLDFIGILEHYERTEGTTNNYLTYYILSNSVQQLDRMRIDIERHKAECRDYLNSKSNENYYTTAYIDELLQHIWNAICNY